MSGRAVERERRVGLRRVIRSAPPVAASEQERARNNGPLTGFLCGLLLLLSLQMKE